MRKENSDNSFLIKEQKNQIDKLTKSEQELKKELLKLSNDTNSSTFELQNQLQKTKDQLKILNSSVTKLHEVVTFSSDEDFYIAVSSAIRQKNQLINDLQHQLQKQEVSSNDSLIIGHTHAQFMNEENKEYCIGQFSIDALQFNYATIEYSLNDSFIQLKNWKYQT